MIRISSDLPVARDGYSVDHIDAEAMCQQPRMFQRFLIHSVIAVPHESALFVAEVHSIELRVFIFLDAFLGVAIVIADAHSVKLDANIGLRHLRFLHEKSPRLSQGARVTALGGYPMGAVATWSSVGRRTPVWV